MWYWHEGTRWWIVFGGLWMLVFWGAVIALSVWVVRKLTERNPSGQSVSGKTNALDIAKERYAKGEISKAEFEQIKKDLS